MRLPAAELHTQSCALVAESRWTGLLSPGLVVDAPTACTEHASARCSAACLAGQHNDQILHRRSQRWLVCSSPVTWACPD